MGYERLFLIELVFKDWLRFGAYGTLSSTPIIHRNCNPQPKVNIRRALTHKQQSIAQYMRLTEAIPMPKGPTDSLCITVMSLQIGNV